MGLAPWLPAQPLLQQAPSTCGGADSTNALLEGLQRELFGGGREAGGSGDPQDQHEVCAWDKDPAESGHTSSPLKTRQG